MTPSIAVFEYALWKRFNSYASCSEYGTNTVEAHSHGEDERLFKLVFVSESEDLRMSDPDYCPMSNRQIRLWPGPAFGEDERF
jgi:hypothetical protein